MPINPKKNSCYGLKKCIQGIWWGKKSLRLEHSPPPSPLPPPPHNCSDGPSIKSFELYGERQRKRNCAINVYAALDQSAQEKWRTILSMVKRVIPCLHFISWKPLAFRILVKLIVSGSLPLKQLKRTSGEWVLWFIIAMTLKSGDKAVYELVFFVSLFVLFCFVFFLTTHVRR